MPKDINTAYNRSSRYRVQRDRESTSQFHDEQQTEGSSSRLISTEQESQNTNNSMSTKERIPRPPNCFILFRTEMRKLCNDSAERSRSSFTSKLWNEMSEDEKKPWREKAKIKKEEHSVKYPGYRYRATPKTVKRKGKGKKGEDKENDGSLTKSTKKSRSSSLQKDHETQIEPSPCLVPLPLTLPLHLNRYPRYEEQQQDLLVSLPDNGLNYGLHVNPQTSYMGGLTAQASSAFVLLPLQPTAIPNAGNSSNLGQFPYVTDHSWEESSGGAHQNSLIFPPWS